MQTNANNGNGNGTSNGKRSRSRNGVRPTLSLSEMTAAFSLVAPRTMSLGTWVDVDENGALVEVTGLRPDADEVTLWPPRKATIATGRDASLAELALDGDGERRRMEDVIRESRAAVMARHYEQGNDIHTGLPLVGEDADDWLDVTCRN